jgi:hypothetical protein
MSIHVGLPLSQPELKKMLENLLQKYIYQDEYADGLLTDAQLNNIVSEWLALGPALDKEINPYAHKDIKLYFDKTGVQHALYVTRPPQLAAKKNHVVLDNITCNHFKVLKHFAWLAELEERDPQLVHINAH